MQTRQLLGELEGHANAVTCAAFSPDGKTLATGSKDQTVILWDVTVRKRREVLRGHANDVICLAFSPDGRTLAASSGDPVYQHNPSRDLKLWDLPSAAGAMVAAGARRTGDFARVFTRRPVARRRRPSAGLRRAALGCGKPPARGQPDRPQGYDHFAGVLTRRQDPGQCRIRLTCETLGPRHRPGAFDAEGPHVSTDVPRVFARQHDSRLRQRSADTRQASARRGDALVRPVGQAFSLTQHWQSQAPPRYVSNRCKAI